MADTQKENSASLKYLLERNNVIENSQSGLFSELERIKNLFGQPRVHKVSSDITFDPDYDLEPSKESCRDKFTMTQRFETGDFGLQELAEPSFSEALESTSKMSLAEPQSSPRKFRSDQNSSEVPKKDHQEKFFEESSEFPRSTQADKNLPEFSEDSPKFPGSTQTPQVPENTQEPTSLLQLPENGPKLSRSMQTQESNRSVEPSQAEELKYSESSQQSIPQPFHPQTQQEVKPKRGGRHYVTKKTINRAKTPKLTLEFLFENIQQLNQKLDSLEPTPQKKKPKLTLNNQAQLENSLQYLEEVIEQIEPITYKSISEVKELKKRLGALEDLCKDNVNGEEFDRLKELVYSIGSGTIKTGQDKPNLTTVVPTKDLNLLREMHKKYEDLQLTVYHFATIGPEQFEDFTNRLRKLEIKVNYKADKNEFQDQFDKLDSLNLKIEKIEKEPIKEPTKKKKGKVDRAELNILSKKISSLEDSLNYLKNLQQPQQVIESDNSELEKLQKSFNANKRHLEGLCQKLDIRINNTNDRFNKVTGVDTKELEAKLTKFFKDYIKKTMDKHFYKEPTQDYSKTSKEDAMFARKPLGGWSCASCERYLENLLGQKVPYYVWNKFPQRETVEKVPKFGKTLSKVSVETEAATTQRTRSKSPFGEKQLPEIQRSVTPKP